MIRILNIANWLMPLLYLALLIDYGAAFFLRTRTAGRSRTLPIVLVVHVLFLVGLGFASGRIVPVGNAEMLSAIALATAIVYCIVEYASRERRTGLFVMAAAFVAQYTSSILDPIESAGGAGAEHYQSHLHIVPAVVAYTAFTLAAVYAVLTLLARRDLKHHKFGLLFDRLPSLELLSKMNWHAMLTGFVFMTLAIATGAMMAIVGGAHSGGMDARVLVKIHVGTAAWVIYAGAIIGRLVGRWNASRVSWVSVLGFVVVMSMLIVSIALS